MIGEDIKNMLSNVTRERDRKQISINFFTTEIKMIKNNDALNGRKKLWTLHKN